MDRWRPWYNQLRNHRFKLEQVVFWDETHKDILIGHSSKFQIRIYRARDGKIDLENGELSEEKFKVNCKYTNQTRLLVGVAKVELPNATIEGRRCEVYQYDDCWVHTIGDYEDT